MIRALVALALSLAAAPAGASEPPHVYVVVVDGLDARFATPERMPRLFGIVAEEKGHVARARAVMPARTNPNHVSLLTASYPDAHGITGNAYWSRVAAAPVAKLEDARLIAVETLFTVVETTAPARVTMGAFGKPKLARLFGTVPGRQHAPDVLWSPESGGVPRDG